MQVRSPFSSVRASYKVFPVVDISSLFSFIYLAIKSKSTNACSQPVPVLSPANPRILIPLGSDTLLLVPNPTY
nr:MAG TPA: hypothetical protein [Bacteriophage sp.]